MTPLERFLARLTAIRAQVDQLPNAVVADLMTDLERVRQQVVGALASAEPGTFHVSRLTALEARLRDIMERFTERYGQILAGPQQQLFEAGQELAGRPLVDAGVTYGVPQISRRQLEIAQAYQASLIQGLAEGAVAEISQALRLGILQGQSVFEVAQQVAGSLTGPSTFGTIATRAEAITRTELGRIQSIATQAGLEEAQRLVPDLKKQWMHSGNTGKWMRVGHQDAHDQIRDVAEPFSVRPGPGYAYEPLMFPRDPAASARNTVNCGCVSIPYRAAWNEGLRQAA